LSVREIAEALVIAPMTARTHVRRIRLGVGARTQRELIMLLWRRRCADLEEKLAECERIRVAQYERVRAALGYREGDRL
jgi:hypothetical protein